jgi:transposase
MTYYVGLDIHKQTVTYDVLTADGRQVMRGTVGTRKQDLQNLGKQLPRPWVGAMETTLFTQHIYRELAPHARKLEVGDSRRMRAMNPSRHKSDRRDAAFQAQLARCGLVPRVHVLSDEQYELRQALRFRAMLVRESVRMHNKTAGLLMESGVAYNKRRLHGPKYFADLLDRLEDVPEIVVHLLKQSQALSDLFTRSQKKLLARLAAHPNLRERVCRLQSIRGVGEVTALTWALEVGDPHRFNSISKAVSYCGLCAAENESAGKHRHRRFSPRCNMHLRSVLIEAAKLAPLHNVQLAKLYQTECESADENLATIAVARKLVAWLLAIDKRKEDFVPPSN